MATVQGILPVLGALLVFNVVTSPATKQSSLISQLLNQVSNQDKPLVLIVDKGADSHGHLTDRDLYGSRYSEPSVFLYKDSHKNQAKNSVSSYNKQRHRAYDDKNKYNDKHLDHHRNDADKREDNYQTKDKKYNYVVNFGKSYNINKYLQSRLRSDDRDRRQRNRHDQDRKRSDRDRNRDYEYYRQNRDSYQDRQSVDQRDDYRYQRQDQDRRNRQRDRNNYRQDQNREDRDRRDRNRYQDKQERQRYNNRLDREDRDRYQDDRAQDRDDDSARANLPIIKSILRSMSCDARNECYNDCYRSLRSSRSETNSCTNECKEDYACNEKEKDPPPTEDYEDLCQSGGSCEEEGPKNISTKGITIEEEPNCKNDQVC